MSYNPDQYWNDIFKHGVDAQSVCYPEWPLTYNHFLHEQQFQTLNEILKKNQIQLYNSSILEVGPGAGFWTEFFKQYNPSNYVGIELSHSSVSLLKSRYPDYHFYCADIGQIQLSTLPISTLDFVYSAMVFLHITDNHKLSFAFEQLANQLKSGGHFILLDSIYAKHVFGNAKEQTDGPNFNSAYHNKIRHIEFYKNLAVKNNLEVVEVRPAFNTSQFCFDFKTYFGYLIWGKLFYAIHNRILKMANNSTGTIYASLQTKLDNLITKKLGLSMSSKWVVLRKK